MGLYGMKTSGNKKPEGLFHPSGFAIVVSY